MIVYLSIIVFAIAAGGVVSNQAAGRPMGNPLTGLAQLFTSFFEWFGELGIFCARVARAAFTRPFEFRELIRQMDSIGSKSLPLVALAGAAVGVVMSLQTRASLARFGAKSMLPTVIIFSMIKETGPIITALVVSGRVAAGIGAELGSMKVTEQIDAMEASAVDPFKYLAATRVIACILMLPLLTIAADFCGVLMGWISETLAEPTSLRLFLNRGMNGVEFSDFLPPTLKTAFFGLIMGVVASFQGMRTKGGTAGVGRSTTSAVVISSILIIVADVILVRLILVFFP
jgi:phospholipid/cholesterol/gamma-HCH transport system permease protein